VLATRGDRLALLRARFEGSGGDVGPSDVEFLQIIEVDLHGDAVAVVAFDPDDLHAAYVELDERYAAGEAAPHAAGWERNQRFWRALAARDWEKLAATFAPGFVLEDHRPLGLLASLSADDYVASVRALLDLRPDATLRLAHVLAIDDRRVLSVGRWAGGEPEGTFEIPVVNAVEFGPDGVRRWHFYNLDQLDEARTCYDRLRPDPLRIPPNAATRAMERFRDAGVAGDWGRFAALFPPAFHLVERRRMVHLEIDREQFLESFRPFFEMTSSTPVDEVLATRGDRLALCRSLWIGADGHSGLSEVEWLTILEVDDRGEPAAAVTFDTEDLAAARAELDRRYAAGEAAAHGRVAAGMGAFVRAIATRDWDAMSAVLSPDLVVNDHRPLGWETLRGSATYVESLKSLVDLAPDVRLRDDHMSFSDRVVLAVDTWVGTRDGGAFEAPRAVVFEFDVSGRVRGMDFYDPEQLEEARARFEAIAATG
jgi:hypothetical protein